MNVSLRETAKKLIPRAFLLAVIFSLFNTISFAATTTVCSVGCDHPTLDAAIAAAVDGDTINLNESQVLTNAITVNKQLTINGNGNTITTSGGNQLFTLTMPGTTISGFNFSKTDKTSQHIIGVQTNNVTISGNTFTGQYVFGDGDVSRAMVISPGVSGLLIDSNTINSFRQPAYIDASSGTISNNYVGGTRGWVIVADANITFTNNSWGTNVIDIAVIPAPTNNYADTNALSAANNNASVENQAGPGSPVLSDVYVDGSAAPGGNGTSMSPYNTIDPAIDRVSVGGVIHVMGASMSTAALVINKSLTIDGAAGASITTSGGNQLFTITSPNVTINNIDFIKTDKTSQHIIGVQANNVSITNNSFTGQYVIGDPEVSRAMVISPGVSGLLVDSNTINNFRQPAYADASSGTISNNYANGTRGWVIVSDANLVLTNNSWGTNVLDIAFIPGASNNYPDVNAVSAANNNANVQNQFSNTTTAVRVTLNQAAGQADPTNNINELNFTAAFDKAIDLLTFTCADITLTNGAVCTGITLVSGNTYNVKVGATAVGAVTATIAAGTVTDTNGNTNYASTSTDNSITYFVGGGGGGGGGGGVSTTVNTPDNDDDCEIGQDYSNGQCLSCTTKPGNSQYDERGTCDWTCNSGYMKSGDQCVLDDDDGTPINDDEELICEAPLDSGKWYRTCGMVADETTGGFTPFYENMECEGVFMRNEGTDFKARQEVV